LVSFVKEYILTTPFLDFLPPFHAYRYYLLGPCSTMADLRNEHFTRSSFNLSAWNFAHA